MGRWSSVVLRCNGVISQYVQLKFNSFAITWDTSLHHLSFTVVPRLHCIVCARVPPPASTPSHVIANMLPRFRCHFLMAGFNGKLVLLTQMPQLSRNEMSPKLNCRCRSWSCWARLDARYEAYAAINFKSPHNKRINHRLRHLLDD